MKHDISEAPPERASALGPVAAYAAFSCLWIFFSDQVLVWLARNPLELHVMSTLKGWLFVLITSLLLYSLVRRQLSRAGELSCREAVATAAQQRAQGLLREIVDSSMDAIFAKDRDGRYLLFNSEASRVTGQPVDRVIGSDDSLLFTPEEAAVVQRNDRRVMEDNRAMSYEETLHTLDGEVVYLATKAPLHDRQGRVIGLFGISRDISQRKRAEARVEAVNRQLQATLDALPDLLFQVSAQHRIVTYHSPRSDLLAAAPEEFLGKRFEEVLPAEASRACEAALDEALADGFSTGHQYRLEVGKGERWFEASVAYRAGTNGDDNEGFVFLARDITERKRIEQELRIASIAFESQQGMMVTDARGVIVRVNRAFTDITGYSAGEAVGSTPRLLHSGRNDAAFYQRMWTRIDRTGYWQGEVWNRRKNGVIYAEWLTISTVRDQDGEVSHYVGAFSDITKDKEAQAEIYRLANYDPLTHLPTRRLLIDQIEQVLVSGTAHGSLAALLLVDIDHFTNLIDTRGHEAGDQLLHEVSTRLKARLRQDDVLATLGGDKFVVLLRALGSDPKQAAGRAGRVAEGLKQTLAEPFCLESGDFHCSASVGTKLFGRGDETVDSVLRHAEVALYQAKAAGRNTLRFFDPAVQSHLDRKVSMESDLHIALECGQFRVYYQPQCDDGGHVVGAEALLRWDHPERGLISPNDFIPLAEDTGLIRPIGQWVLETVCSQLVAWSAIAELSQVPVAVNVSARQFRHPDFVDSVRNTLRRTGAPPQRLKLELTESLVVHDLQDTYEKMKVLKEIGITLSLDDFGTGNSSLSYLTRLPLDQLKIDKSFVCHLPENENDSIICQTIIAMARGLGLSVIAEGVETDAQRTLLAQQGCHMYQGYLFNRPLPQAVFEEFVQIASIA